MRPNEWITWRDVGVFAIACAFMVGLAGIVNIICCCHEHPKASGHFSRRYHGQYDYLLKQAEGK